MSRPGFGSGSCLKTDKAQDKFQVHLCQVTCAPLHRARYRFGEFKVDEDEVSLARRESRADFPSVSLQILDSSEWRLAAYSGFFREENITLLEARSILYAVRYAENSYPSDAS